MRCAASPRMQQRDAGRRAVFAEDTAQGLAPFAGGDARLGAGDRRLHDVAAFACRGVESLRARLCAPCASRLRAPGLQSLDLLVFDILGHGQDGLAILGGKRRGLR